MLRIQRVNPDRITHLRETIGQGPDRGDFRRLNAGVNQGLDPGFAPTLGHLLNVVVEIAEDDVAMAVDKTKIPRRSSD
jgi:hypothetical protein